MIEPALFYRACDELGLLVIQDMPSMPLRTPNAAQQVEFARQLELLINQLKNYPSIYTWVCSSSLAKPSSGLQLNSQLIV